MHDLKQLAADAIRVISSPILLEAEPMRLAAFARDLLDETPVDAEWLRAVSPKYKWFMTFAMTGPNLRFLNEGQSIVLGTGWTRGRVRAFALGMGLQLREGEG